MHPARPGLPRASPARDCATPRGEVRTAAQGRGLLPRPRRGLRRRSSRWPPALRSPARWTRSPARSNNGAPNRAGRGAGSTRLSVAPLCFTTARQVLPTAAITPLLPSASPSRGRMETPGVMSALRPGTDRQQEEEPRPGATGSAAGRLEWVTKAGGAARRAGGRWQCPPSVPPSARACRTEGTQGPGRLQLHPSVKEQGAARPEGTP